LFYFYRQSLDMLKTAASGLISDARKKITGDWDENPGIK
jgi:hypothetical protein